MIGHMFREKFGWNLPEDWELLAEEIHKDERGHSRGGMLDGSLWWLAGKAGDLVKFKNNWIACF